MFGLGAASCILKKLTHEDLFLSSRTYERLQSVASGMQVLMFVQIYWQIYAFPDADPEYWKQASKPSVPPRYQCRTPGEMGTDLRHVLSEFVVGRRAIELARELGYDMFDGSHVEHVACEKRKHDAGFAWPRVSRFKFTY